MRPSVVRDLRLKDHGLSLVAPEIRAFAPSPDGRGIALWADVARTAEGFRWGPAPLPPIDLERKENLFDPSRGDDGRLSARFLLRFQAIIDMPHRWAYLKPETGEGGNRP